MSATKEPEMFAVTLVFASKEDRAKYLRAMEYRFQENLRWDTNKGDLFDDTPPPLELDIDGVEL